AAQRGQDDADRRRLVARSVLDRMSRPKLTETQRRFLNHPTMLALRDELRRFALEPMEWSALLSDIEQYEATGESLAARRVAERIQRLALSPVAERQRLGEHLAMCYRNANMRVAASADFLNRLIPERPAEFDCVDDCVLGRRVRGHSVTSTEVKVRLVPDAEKLRAALQIDGLVSSLTRSSSGPARFLNTNQSTYSAWKEVEIGPGGMNILPAQVCVHSDLRLHGLSTDFDGLPLVGAIVQEMARSGHESRRGEANAEIEGKVYARAKAQVDAEADARLGELARRIEQRLVGPLADLSLGPKVISAETTEQRVVLRVRLAADDQLGGHTPRPMAPADCLASVQVHESALTNVVGRMQIDGGTFTLSELRRRIAERFNRPESNPQDADEEDLTLTFAPRNAARVRCVDGKVVLTVAIAKLVREGQVYEDFQVRAVYTPQARGLVAELVRDDVIHLSGPRLNTRSQIALRGIFSKAFSKHKPWQLLPDRITQDSRMAGLAVTQLVVEDGWLGIAVGPKRDAVPATARRSGG
ncbi:MAG: hypothetical protein NUV77_20090, partial [Thermoguttaceae bacterium]|nr:hypothetical protein [Thermoguttaceae bacterium]